MYQQYLDGEDVLKRPREEDPFWEPTEDVLIGTASVFLQSLSYALDFEDKLTITDYKGLEEGHLFVNITPCNQAGRTLDEDSFVDEPSELLGKPYHFKVSQSLLLEVSRCSSGLLAILRVQSLLLFSSLVFCVCVFFACETALWMSPTSCSGSPITSRSVAAL